MYHAMDEYKTATLGSQVRVDNFWHENMTAPRTLAVQDYQELSSRTILMGYLLREHETRLDRKNAMLW